MSDSTTTVRRFLAALEQRDATQIEPLLTDDVVEMLPFAADGGTAPTAMFEGRDRVVEVQRVIVNSFASVAFTNAEYTESADGQTVFVEAQGERVHAETGKTYRNGYVLKFEFRDGLIGRITEYSNPVAFAVFFGQPVG